MGNGDRNPRFANGGWLVPVIVASAIFWIAVAVWAF